MKSIYVNSENKATIVCPGCGREKTIDASKFMKVDGPVKIKYKFKCDYCARKSKKSKDQTSTDMPDPTSIVILERRKSYRKKVDFPGFLIDQRGKKEMIVINDLSRTGLKFSLKSPWPLNIDDKITIQFHLDNNPRTLIKKETLVKKIDKLMISVEFSSIRSYSETDKAIGFYLMG
ncbi:MAG: PilZ domain-containing protein [Desulfobacteraceae bacterium]|nr:PilZ domain-containing protein [Desulfobacteraceae bacterium]MBC2757545.1 PilZ domain-containing protein [Desulfobacteraceae bacterium]